MSSDLIGCQRNGLLIDVHGLVVAKQSGGKRGPAPIRVELERLAEQHPCLAVIVLGEMPEQLKALHHVFPGIEILGALVPNAGLLAFDQTNMEC